jgi:hypothetical protein
MYGRSPPVSTCRVAGEVALADLAGESSRSATCRRCDQAAGQLVRAGVGKREADDPVQLLHRLAGELLEVEVDALEADQPVSVPSKLAAVSPILISR